MNPAVAHMLSPSIEKKVKKSAFVLNVIAGNILVFQHLEQCVPYVAIMQRDEVVPVPQCHTIRHTGNLEAIPM